MGVSGKLEVEVDIKPSGDVFHELIGSRPHHVSTIVPHHVHGCNLHEGEFGQPGSIIEWEYIVDGEKCVDKQVVEVIDEDKKLIRLKCLEGTDFLQIYKNFIVTIQVIPKGDYDAIKWAIEFERFDDFGSYPTNIMDFFIKMTRDIEAHHVNA